MTNHPEIAIIGVGIHPFGRYADRSALDMGAVAITRELHPSRPRAINSYGVKIDHQVYDSDELNPYRGQLSGVKELGDRWAVHYHP